METSARQREAGGRPSLPGWDGTGYKVVAKVGPRYFSVWAGEGCQYGLGVTSTDAARPHHRGGLYVCRSLREAAEHYIPSKPGGLFVSPRVVLRCLCEGPFVEYPGGKIACSALTPVEELALPRGYVHSAQAAQQAQVRPLPMPPLSPASIAGRPASALRRETLALEAEVAAMERQLGYR